MAISGLSIIGESINDSVPSTHKLFEAHDIDGIVALAKTQDEKGAAYIDVNVGLRSPEFMAEMVGKIQAVTSKPLCIDTPDPTIAAAGLKAYNAARAGGALPILNSISQLRMEMLDLYKIQPFKPILMVSERAEGNTRAPNQTAEQTYETTKSLIKAIRQSPHKIPIDHCIVDTGIAPIGTDYEMQLKRVIESLRLIHGDKDLAGIHASVGLSNFTVMLPPKRPDGSPVKSALESAFLTMAMPLGLDMVIGSLARKYEVLAETHPAMECLRAVLSSDGYGALEHVMAFYS